MIKDYIINIGHPVKVSSILENDLWVFENFNQAMVNSVNHPVKFSAQTSIFVRKGTCSAEINLITSEIKAPCIVNIRDNQILEPKDISDDFEASCLVLSNKISSRIFSHLSNTSYSTLVRRYPVVGIDDKYVDDYLRLYAWCSRMMHEKDNPYAEEALIHLLMAFFFNIGYKSYDNVNNMFPSSPGRLTDRFITLVQENFKKERFLDFYASKLEITSKHLSRSIKQQTGCTAVEWIDKFVVLEAQALLKSSNLNIQQIADELNFPSQSFFGKYFKKHTGLSPKEFRNK